MKPIRDFRHPIRRFVFRRRRPIAATLVFVAVLTGLSAFQTERGGSPVVVAARDVAAGEVLTAADLTTVEWVAKTPDGSAKDVTKFAGERTASPIGEGEALTDLRILGPALLDGYSPSAVVTTIRIADGAALTGMRSGDGVAVIGTDPESGKATIIGRDIHLLSHATVDSESSDQGVSIQVIAPETDALKLAEVSLDSRLTLVAISSKSAR